MSLLENNGVRVFKPFQYPWAYEAWKTQRKMDWVGWEIDFSSDIKDWNNNLSQNEKHLLTHIFRFFTQSDVEVNDNYMTKYSQVFKPVEIQMMLAAFANMETTHIDAYSLIIETVGMPDTTYSEFLDYKEMKDKYDFLQGFSVNSKRGIAKTLAGFGAFTEGVSLFASFAILLNFPRHNRMRGMGQVVSLSVKDESLHCESMIRLFRTFIQEHPRIWDDELKAEIYAMAEKVVMLEDFFIDLAFSQGGIQNLTAGEVKEYIRYIADRRLIELGMKNIFKQKTNPLPWIDYMINGVEHSNFFENKAVTYAKASTQGTWGEVFENFVPTPKRA